MIKSNKTVCEVDTAYSATMALGGGARRWDTVSPSYRSTLSLNSIHQSHWGQGPAKQEVKSLNNLWQWQNFRSCISVLILNVQLHNVSDVSEPQKHVEDDICKILSCLVNIIRWNIIEKILQDEIILPLGS